MKIEYGGNAVKSILKDIGMSVLVAIGGVVFMELFAMFMNGMEQDTARVIGIVLYSCMTTVVCTGVIISHIKKK